MAREVARHTGETPPVDLAVFVLKLDADVIPSQESGSDQAAARSGEWVQDDIAGLGEGFNNGHERVDGLLGWMAVIFGFARIAVVGYKDDIGVCPL